MKKKLLLLILMMFVASSGWASEVIRSIEVKGNQHVEQAAILATIGSQVGAAYSTDQVRKDIQSLFKMGSFDDVIVEKESTASGIRLIFQVHERSKINKISFEGNKKVKTDKLRELIDVKPFVAPDSTRLASSLKKIRDHYATEGYHLAEISTEFKSPPEGGAPTGGDQELIFHIHEGEQVKIRRVNFIGNKQIKDKELKSTIKSREKGYWSWIGGGGKYQDEMVKRDAAFLVYDYQNKGFLKVKVTTPKVYLSRDRKAITVTFHITEGEKYKVSKVGIEGEILTTKEELESKLKVKPGNLYSRKTVEEDLTLLSQLYGDQGYAFANINPNIEAHDEDHTADIIYSVQKGPRVFIDKINIQGNTITRDKVIRRELLIKENTLYNESQIRLSQQKLQALGYFEEVNFATPRGTGDDRININITVKEKPTGTFSIGAGFSSVENFIFQSSVSKQNFLGYGINGQFSIELSSKRQLFLLSFEDPYFLDSNWILGLSGFRTVNVFTDFSRKSFGGSASLGHRIFENSIFKLGYEVENVDVSDFQTTVPAIFAGNLSGLTSASSTSLIRDTRNNRITPSSGMYQSVTMEYAGLGGDNNFIRATENFRYYQPIWKSILGKFNLTYGQINSLKDTPVPLFERYFLGGVNSLRGYFLRSIGPSVRIPTSPQGGDNRFVFGGTKLIQFNFEVEFPLYDPAGFRLVSFVDSGNTFGEDENVSLRQLRSDYGFGLRWNSPFGPLRFEWGIPIDQQPGEDSVVFNFTIGSFF